MGARFVESGKFPVWVVNEASAKEKGGGGRPDYWEMVFWWTRKPLASARAVIAGALLPEDIDTQRFVSNIVCAQIQENKVVNVPHRANPRLPPEWRKYFEGKKLLDPFAGFGSIPLEALRLGLSKVVAVELLPTAYVFLKAVLEYPLKYGKQLVEDVEKWGTWVTERLREDPLISELYEPDVAVYIGTWEVKCPHCGRWTPLVGNWWLARVKGGEGEEEEEEGVSSGPFKRLAWMTYRVEDGEVKIGVTDLNKELGFKKKMQIQAKVDTKQGKVTVGSRSFAVPKPNIERNERATCLCCGNSIRLFDPQNGQHYTDNKKLSKEVKQHLVWYVKYVLQKYHEGDESYARPRLFVKVKLKDKDLEFEPCTEEDQQELE